MRLTCASACMSTLRFDEFLLVLRRCVVPVVHRESLGAPTCDSKSVLLALSRYVVLLLYSGCLLAFSVVFYLLFKNYTTCVV